jgi:SAM-dependent methyltransferase
MSRYQDYVIRDGQLIGEFEPMYQRFADPWHQTTAEHSTLSQSKNATLVNLRKYGIRSVVEFGCGLGYLTNMIRTCTNAEVLGVDISETAVKKARATFPSCRFTVDSVCNLPAYSEYDAVLFAEITWYILADLQKAFEDIQEKFRGKYFLHNLVFYKPGVQQHGREYFTNLNQFVSYCPFRLLEWTTASTSEPDSTSETSAIFKIEPKR